MQNRYRTPFRSGLRPFLLGHCFFSSVLLLCQAELQRSCSQLGSQRQGEHCQSLCHCRYYPPLPPPPPPPPPPRLLILTVAEPPVPLPRPWWKDVVVVTVGCTSAFFLLLILLICYKAIKWKPLKKQENGTSRGEYAMSCRKRKITNNVVV
ncbi:proline-rich membrane anchor 1-like isoform 2-T2 [Clarias gariepinus]|uniref:proline-rich membrane anchor 1-like isoform X2 n=1 Tax=Clarias gariepinus TaxID=13013 RepID=UPI00234E1FC8|nr:proline-rich membrane anchor 1-like isoform X2 [Clarias gariepinus]